MGEMDLRLPIIPDRLVNSKMSGGCCVNPGISRSHLLQGVSPMSDDLAKNEAARMQVRDHEATVDASAGFPRSASGVR